MLLFIVLILLSMVPMVYADVYVITDPNGSVYSISDVNDAVIPSGYKLTVMKGKNIKDLPISGDTQLYNFNNGGFNLNNKAFLARQAVQKQMAADADARAQAKLSAIKKLTDAITKVNPSDVLTNEELQAILPSN